MKSKSRIFSKWNISLLLFGILCLAQLSTSLSSEKIDLDQNDVPQFSAELRKIAFSGYNWTVRDSNAQLQGPGPNVFNGSENSVWIDNDGYLHLKITKSEQGWQCAEVYSDKSFGYGTYVFTMQSGFEYLDVNIVLGLFTYLDDEHEIDIEFARWGHSENNNGQFVTQPYRNEDNIHRFEMEETGEISNHGFQWCENDISYWSDYGGYQGLNSTPKIANWNYEGQHNPEPSTERVHLNLWLMSGLSPMNDAESEVIIQSFQFIPDPCPEQDIEWISISFLSIMSILGIAILLISKNYSIRTHHTEAVFLKKCPKNLN